MLTRLNRWILFLLLALGVPWYWLLIQNSPGDARPKPVTMAQLRTLATRDGRQLPYAIRYELVGSESRSGNLVAAGIGFRDHPLDDYSYLIQYNDLDPVVVGSGISAAEAAKSSFDRVDAGAQRRIAGALESAAQFVPLAPDPTQTGGLMTLPASGQKERLLAGVARLGVLGQVADPAAIAPGVVVIPTGSWRPESRMVYVRLDDGREYLFAGSLSQIEENWRQVRAPGRLFTNWYRDDNRAEIYSWLLTVNSLRRQAPGLIVIPGNQLIRNSGILRYFPVPSRE